MCKELETNCEVNRVMFGDTVTKYQIMVEVTPEEWKACQYDMADIPAWIHNAIYNKARQMIDFLVEQSGEGSRFTPIEKKLEIIKAMAAKTH